VNEPEAQRTEPDETATLESEVDEAIALCDGDVRAALKATLVANSFLMAENEKLIRCASLGFGRGKMPARRRASVRLDDWREISSSEEQ
jgi:hypothetical protein